MSWVPARPDPAPGFSQWLAAALPGLFLRALSISPARPQEVRLCPEDAWSSQSLPAISVNLQNPANIVREGVSACLQGAYFLQQVCSPGSPGRGHCGLSILGRMTLPLRSLSFLRVTRILQILTRVSASWPSNCCPQAENAPGVELHSSCFGESLPGCCFMLLKLHSLCSFLGTLQLRILASSAFCNLVGSFLFYRVGRHWFTASYMEIPAALWKFLGDFRENQLI